MALLAPQSGRLTDRYGQHAVLVPGVLVLGQATGSMAAGQLSDGFGSGTGFLAPLAGTGLALGALVCFRRRLAQGPDGRAAGARGVGHRASVAVD